MQKHQSTVDGLEGFTPNPSCPTLLEDERESLMVYLKATPAQRRVVLEQSQKYGGVSGSLLHAMKWLLTA